MGARSCKLKPTMHATHWRKMRTCEFPNLIPRTRVITVNHSTAMKQTSLDNFSSTGSKRQMWSKEGLQSKIVKCIVECNLSMNLVEMPSFRRLLCFQHGANANGSDIPHRTKLAALIDNAAYNINNHLKDKFNSLPDGCQVSFTFDGWTSINMTPYIAVTAHYVPRDWKLW